MCSNLSEPGGFRCEIHKLGSRALISNTAVEAGVSIADCKAAFKALRKEGKDLPPPTAQEVREFTESERVRAKFNPALSKYQSTIAQRRWAAAKDDEPDGGTFHAWKNTLSEVRKRFKNKVIAIGLTGVLAAGVGACASEPVQMEIPTANPSPSATQTVDAMPYELDTSSHVDLGISVDESVEFSLSNGTTYHPLTVDPDSPALTLEESDFRGGSSAEVYEHFTKEEVEESIGKFSQVAVRDIYSSPATFESTQEQARAQYEHMKQYIGNNPDDPAWESSSLLQSLQVYKRGSVNPTAWTYIPSKENPDAAPIAISEFEVGDIYYNSNTETLNYTVRAAVSYDAEYNASPTTPEEQKEAGADHDGTKWNGRYSTLVLQDRLFATSKDSSGVWMIDGISAQESGLIDKAWLNSSEDKAGEPDTVKTNPSFDIGNTSKNEPQDF